MKRGGVVEVKSGRERSGAHCLLWRPFAKTLRWRDAPAALEWRELPLWVRGDG